MEKTQKCKQCGREIFFDGICVSCRAENERNMILNLSQNELDAQIQKICDEIAHKGKLDENEELFKKLLNYRDINTSQIADIAFQKNVYYPSEIYKDASQNIVNSMLETLQSDQIDSSTASGLLLCLAIRGGEDVFRVFKELENRPRKWRKKLYVNPSFYATYGGWSYDENGKFCDTNYSKCFPMVKGTTSDKELSPVKIGIRTGETCPHCGCKVVNLMEIDGTDPRLDFLGIPGKIKIKCCPNCFVYSDGAYCRFSINGESEIILDNDNITENYMTDADMDELSGNTYVLGKNSVPVRYAADWEGGSSIGGFAFWIQDCEIKKCPECGKPMKYLAQIQWDNVLDGMEGNAYIEICDDCKIAVVMHQQT